MAIDSRRRNLVLGAAAAGACAQFGLVRSAFSQSARLSSVPTVDSLTIRVLTDSSYDTPRVGTSKWVKTRRVGLVSPLDPTKTLHNEWGLALALESHTGGESRQILLDFGYTPNALLNNMEIIRVDGAKTQALIASHGHFDHFGGLIGYLQKYRDQLPADLPLYIGGEDLFCVRKNATGTPGHFADWGVLDRREWREATGFDQADRNRDGMVTLHEYLNQPPVGYRDARFDDMDHNGDGLLTRYEWHGDRESFEQMDRNDDGVVTSREFVQQRYPY